MLSIRIIPVSPVQQNCALIFDTDTKRGVLIDPGGDVPDILAAIDAEGVTVERVLLTHGHFDHVGGVPALRAAFAARGQMVPVLGPDARDQPLIDNLPRQGELYGIPGLAAFTPDRHLTHGEHIDIAGEAFEVRFTPGHSPGHVIFVAPGAAFAILGDVLFNGSVGRTDLAGGDTATLMASIRDQVMTLPDATPFICGHGPASTIGTERRTNPFLRD